MATGASPASIYRVHELNEREQQLLMEVNAHRRGIERINI